MVHFYCRLFAIFKSFRCHQNIWWTWGYKDLQRFTLCTILITRSSAVYVYLVTAWRLRDYKFYVAQLRAEASKPTWAMKLNNVNIFETFFCCFCILNIFILNYIITIREIGECKLTLLRWVSMNRQYQIFAFLKYDLRNSFKNRNTIAHGLSFICLVWNFIAFFRFLTQ